MLRVLRDKAYVDRAEIKSSLLQQYDRIDKQTINALLELLTEPTKHFEEFSEAAQVKYL